MKFTSEIQSTEGRKFGPAIIVFILGVFFISPLAAATGWQELPSTTLQNVCPPDNYGGSSYGFSSFCHNVIDAWSGAIADTGRNRLIIWGGGHTDYYGNEIYSLNLGTTPVTLTRLTNPSLPIADSTCPAALADGTPNSRHTSNNLAYIQHLDRMFVFNGGLACGNGSNAKDTWTLDLGTLQWQRMDPVNGPTVPSSGCCNYWAVAAYDPNTQTVFMKWGGSFWQYKYETNTYTLLDNSSPVQYSATGVIDPQRKLFVFMGTEFNSTTPKVLAISLAAGSNYAVQDWSAQVTGCDALAGANYPGLAYDSTLDRIVGWPNAGNTVYLFNPDTKTCTPQFFANGPQNPVNPTGSGTFGRFAYFPALNRYAVVSKADLNAFSLSLSGSGPVSPPPDTTPPTISMLLPASGTVAGTVAVTATASDNVGVSSVQFKLDGANLGAPATSSPFTIIWTTTTATDGVHSLSAVAQDAAGNTATAVAISVTVANGSGSGGGTPPPSTPGNGLGWSTFTCLDVDGDGYGVGPGCTGPDADDTDATIHSGAQGITKYGTLTAFIAHIGYTPSHFWCLSPTGNDGTGARSTDAGIACNSPFRTWAGISASVAAGDMILLRNNWNGQISTPNGSFGNPIIFMSYPGELAIFNATDGLSEGINILNRSWLIVDNIKFTNAACMSGGTSDGNYPNSIFHDNIFRHIEGTNCEWGFSSFNGLVNVTLEYSVFHDNCPNGCQHGIYMGSRGIPSSNVVVRRNITYQNEWLGFQWNGRCSNCSFDQNISYNNGLSGIGLDMGLHDSFVRGNLLFNNGAAGIILTNYRGACYNGSDVYAPPPVNDVNYICPFDQINNVIENNTIYNTGKDWTGASNTGQAAIHIVNDTPDFRGDLGHNTYRNNIVAGYDTSDLGFGAPIIWFEDTSQNYLATSTFTNILAFAVSGNTQGTILGKGTGGGFNKYTCAQAAAVTTITNCNVANPQFVAASPAFWNSPSSFNFKLQSTSPALGTGTSGVTNYDLIGNAYGNPPSRGAYESSSSGSVHLSCDLNADGAVNVIDVQNAVNQALGITACTTADLSQNGHCDILDVQRVITAALGSACVLGP